MAGKSDFIDLPARQLGFQSLGISWVRLHFLLLCRYVYVLDVSQLVKKSKEDRL